MKGLSGDEAGEKFVIPSGDFTLESKADLAGRSSDRVEGDVLDGGEIGRGVLGADTAFVIAEDHVHNPMQAVLDRPMSTDNWPDLGGEPDQGRDVEAGLALDFVADLARALDHDDAFQSRPTVAFLQPRDIVERRVGPGFDATMVAIDGLGPAHLCVLEAVGLLLSCEQLDVLAKGALVAFECENVMARIFAAISR